MTELIADFATLRASVRGSVVTAGEAAWDGARAAWNLELDQRPAAVVLPESTDDVAATVAFAAEHGLRVAPQGTGHNAAPLGSLEGTILLRTARMNGVTVDPDARRCRAQAGAVWLDVLRATAGHGLVALTGTSPDVGVVGYTVGGGIGWFGRKHGWTCNSALAFEVVTADGAVVRADRDRNPDLFWALRGGGGSFGVVTEVELELFALPELQAGALYWPLADTGAVLRAWRDWTADLDEAMTSIFRVLQLPDLPVLPEALRGRSWVTVEVAHAGDAASADAALTALRALDPARDTVRGMDLTELPFVHMDPAEPVPSAGDGGLLRELPDPCIEAIVGVVGDDSGSPLLSFELRDCSGALARPSADAGALASLDGFAMFAVGLPTPDVPAHAIHDHVRAVDEAVAPWASGSRYCNFAESTVDPACFFGRETYRRLREIKAAVDPGELLHANHPIPAATEVPQT